MGEGQWVRRTAEGCYSERRILNPQVPAGHGRGQRLPCHTQLVPPSIASWAVLLFEC